ncbi:hypothetical protein GGS26DRAFT_282099 [Hypomontagnella submonticulosa]|nr:hypothetical protein GGS26DRAFT_282099 [Hypomontagnella submonticulosa]
MHIPNVHFIQAVFVSLRGLIRLSLACGCMCVLPHTNSSSQTISMAEAACRVMAVSSCCGAVHRTYAYLISISTC